MATEPAPVPKPKAPRQVVEVEEIPGGRIRVWDDDRITVSLGEQAEVKR